MKTVVIGMPEALPPELATNPDVLVVDPAMLPEEVLAALNEATGGMLGEEEGGEGALESWAKEEEAEHGMGGYGDDEDKEREGGSEGDDEEKDPIGGEGEDEDGRESGGEGEDEEEREKSAMRGRGGRAAPRRFDMTISGRGAAVPPLATWAKAMGRGGR